MIAPKHAPGNNGSLRQGNVDGARFIWISAAWGSPDALAAEYGPMDLATPDPASLSYPHAVVRKVSA